MRQVPPLRAGLEHAAGAAHRLGQRQALRDVLGARLFAVHVLAGLGRQTRRGGMPVRPRGDQHRVDVVAGQQVAQVAIRRTVLIAVLLVGHLLDLGTPLGLHVADGHELHVRFWQKAAEVVGAPVADADAAQHDPFAGRHGAVFAQRRARDQAGAITQCWPWPRSSRTDAEKHLSASTCWVS